VIVKPVAVMCRLPRAVRGDRLALRRSPLPKAIPLEGEQEGSEG
jgi:hypothetical protein